ncbi:MAG: hypothetical protein ACFFD2_31025 [Promethearchaeota archaeon]
MKYNTIIFDLGFTLVTFENFTLERYFATLDQGLDRMTTFLIEGKMLNNPKEFKKNFKKLRNYHFQQALTDYKETSTETILSESIILWKDLFGKSVLL